MAPVIAPITVVGVFDKYIKSTFLKEGGEQYTNDPNDRGGETKWGITVARARLAGYQGRMIDLTYDQAYSIYLMFFWSQPGFDKIAFYSTDLAGFMLDIGVNRGPTVPSRWLQRILNVMNGGATLWPDLLVDGHIGMGTASALNRYLIHRRSQNGAQVLLFAMRALATSEYIAIAENNPSQESFEFGWISQRAFA